MQSRTSFFNKTVYAKTLKRFWPLWAACAGVWFLTMPLSVLNWNNGMMTLLARQNNVLSLAAAASPLLNAGFAILTAMAVFGWLYQSRSVSFTSALPVSRESMFLSSAAAGATVLIGAETLAALTGWLFSLTAGGGAETEFLEFLAISVMDTMSFYGFALLCAQLTGSLLILPLVYGVLQMTAVVVELLADYILNHINFGFDLSTGFLSALSPLVQRVSNCHPEPVHSEPDALGVTKVLSYRFVGWGTVIGYAVFGLGCFLLAFCLYRNRRMESAGDTVAIGVLKPVFRWCMALGGSLVAGSGIHYLLNGGRYVPGTPAQTAIIAALMVLGALVGWFCADMLIFKTFRVFPMHRKGAVLACALVLGFCFGAEADLLGAERRLPELSEVDCVYVNSWGESVRLSEEESLAEALELQRSIIANKAIHESRSAVQPDETGSPIVYEAVNGLRRVDIVWYRDDAKTGDSNVVLSRSYYLSCYPEQLENRSSDIRALERLLNCTEAVMQRKELSVPVQPDTIENACIAQSDRYDWEEEDWFFDSVPETEEIFLGRDDSLVLSAQAAYELYTTCLLPDMEEGTLGRIWLIQDEDYARTVYNLTISMNLLEANGLEHQYDYFYTVPTVNARRTVEWLRQHGIEPETLYDCWQRTGMLGGQMMEYALPEAVDEYT